MVRIIEDFNFCSQFYSSRILFISLFLQEERQEEEEEEEEPRKNFEGIKRKTIGIVYKGVQQIASNAGTRGNTFNQD